jgi:threonine aldolase
LHYSCKNRFNSHLSSKDNKSTKMRHRGLHILHRQALISDIVFFEFSCCLKGVSSKEQLLVYTNTRAPKYIFTIIKRHGALLAKGRVLGLQFDTLFTDDLYFRVSRHAIDMAQALRRVFAKHGLSLGIDSPTNQQFVILSKEQKQRLAEEIAFEIWEPLPDDHLLCRFVTCWATTEADIAALDEALKRTLAANA